MLRTASTAEPKMIEISCEVKAEKCSVNTELLIVEVEVRPVLYDQALHQAYSDTEVLRNWAEIAHVLEANRTDCLRTWKKLVKTFSYFFQTSETLLEQWSFFEHMKFLLPYANELVLYDDLDHIDEELDLGDHLVFESEADDLLAETDEMDTDGEEHDDRLTTSTPIDSATAQQHRQDDDDDDDDNGEVNHQNDAQHMKAKDSGHAKLAAPATAKSASIAASDRLDASLVGNEELFLLSFAPSMTRLTVKQNAFARLRILEELYKLEFE